MLDFFKIFPLELVLLTLIFVILPTIIAGILRHSLYLYLMNAANKVLRLLSSQKSRGKQPKIVNDLEKRFRQASEKLEQVNTIALIDGLYSQERLSFLGISLRCEQWDYFCQTLPNLLLAFGLLGTFIGISSNLYNLSQTIDGDFNTISELIAQLQTPLQNMGIAFFTSLTAIACSSILIGINLRCNTNFAKSLLISSLEDYLDNIFKIKIEGYSRLDLAVDRMVKQQEDFLYRFHEKVGEVLETTIGNAANQMVKANQGFQNNVDNLVSRFNDVSSSLVTSTNNFQDSVATLSIIVETDFVDKLATATKELTNIPQQFDRSTEILHRSTDSLGKAIDNINISATEIMNLIQKVNNLNQYSSKLLESSDRKIELEKTEFQQIQSELNAIVNKLHKHQEQVNLGLEKFGGKLLNSFEQQTNNNTKEVTNLIDKTDEFVGQMRENKTEITKLISRLEYCLNNLNSVNDNFSRQNIKLTKEPNNI